MASHSVTSAKSIRRPDTDNLHSPDFDLRDILAATTVEELSFAEFLAALQQYGKQGF